ncbi:MAG: hypothetical protein WAW52_12650 [Methanothrix sp.]
MYIYKNLPGIMDLIRNRKQNTYWEITDERHLKRLRDDPETYEVVKVCPYISRRKKKLEKEMPKKRIHNPDNISKLTKRQMKMFEKINRDLTSKSDEKELTSKEKCDFYCRMSKILTKKLDELEKISCLLDEVPLSYQNKIDLMGPAINAMDIIEKLVKRLDPAYPSPIIRDSKGNECDIREAPPEGEEWNFVGRRVVRHFTVDMKSYLPGVEDTDAVIETCYEPSSDEVAFLHRLTDHQWKLERIREESTHNHKRLAVEEFREVILPKLEKRGTNFKARVVCIVGDYECDTTQKESEEEFHKTEQSIGI